MCFSSHSELFQTGFEFPAYYFLQDVFQEDHTFGEWMYDCVKSSVVAPSLLACKCTFISYVWVQPLWLETARTSHFYKAVQHELCVGIIISTLVPH